MSANDDHLVTTRVLPGWVIGAAGYTDPIRLNIVEQQTPTESESVNARYYLTVEQARELIDALEHAIGRATRPLGRRQL